MENPQQAAGMQTPPNSLVTNTKDEAIRALEIEAATVESRYMSPVVWKQMLAMADTFVKSHALPGYIQNVFQAQVVLQAGLELGLKPIESFNSLYIVNGAVNLWGKAVIRQLKRHGWDIEYLESTQEMCKARVTKGSTSYTEEITFDEATAGLTNLEKRPGWTKGINRKMKLRYVVLSIIIKSYIPEVLGSAEGIAEVAEDTVTLPEYTDHEGVVHEEAKVEVKRSSAADFINRKKQTLHEAQTPETKTPEASADEPQEVEGKTPETKPKKQKPDQG